MMVWKRNADSGDGTHLPWAQWTRTEFPFESSSITSFTVTLNTFSCMMTKGFYIFFIVHKNHMAVPLVSEYVDAGKYSTSGSSRCSRSSLRCRKVTFAWNQYPLSNIADKCEKLDLWQLCGPSLKSFRIFRAKSRLESPSSVHYKTHLLANHCI